MKRFTIACLSLLTTLALAGCSQQQGGQAGYIGSDAAQTVALEAAGVSKSNASVTSTELGQRNGLDYYTVLFTADGQEYEYDIDAVTGVVIDQKVNGQATGDDAGGSVTALNGQTADTGAQTASGGNGADNSSSAQQGSASSSSSGLIGEDAAKNAALKHAGLSANNVTFLRCKLDWDDGRQTYDVEFYTADYKEYDYEIDAQTGAVLSYDFDAEYYTPSNGGSNAGGSTQAISADEAKSLALSQVPGATASNIREPKVDYHARRVEYEGSILYNGMEYEFEIDGYSGAIRNWEAESWYD